MSHEKEQRFLSALRARWPSPELTPAEQAAFDARLRQRLDARPRHRIWGAVALAAASAAAVLWLWREPGEPEGWIDALAAADAEIAGESTAASNEVAIWLSSPALDGNLAAFLPAHYQAMADWLAPGAGTSAALNPNQ
ncbi:MAG: hypothetical protein HYZ27_00035 [Deltaproteobacteria bacterium]|nr:hypothetical protein [Deltaproteobacteria bacterium]